MPSTPRVLIVDDDLDISLALSDYLSREGYEVEVAETGNAALQNALSKTYDAVLLDVGLPDRDGIDVLVQLAELKPHLPIILLTAFTTLPKTTHPEKINKAFAYLTKPFNREMVKATIHRALTRPEDLKIKVGPLSTPMVAPVKIPSIIQPSPSEQHKTSGPHFQLPLEEYQKLAEYVQFMRFAFDQVPEAILIADTEKRIRFGNQAACKALGYTKEELETLRIPDFAPNHDNDRYQEHLRELRQGKTLSYYTTHRTKDGDNFPIEISVYLLSFHGQEFTCAITKPEPGKV